MFLLIVPISIIVAFVRTWLVDKSP